MRRARSETRDEGNRNIACHLASCNASHPLHAFQVAKATLSFQPRQSFILHFFNSLQCSPSPCCLLGLGAQKLSLYTLIAPGLSLPSEANLSRSASTARTAQHGRSLPNNATVWYHDGSATTGHLRKRNQDIGMQSVNKPNKNLKTLLSRPPPPLPRRPACAARRPNRPSRRAGSWRSHNEKKCTGRTACRERGCCWQPPGWGSARSCTAFE